MFRGTTPTIIFKLKNDDIDLTKIDQIWVTFKTPSAILRKDINDITIDAMEKTISVSLTQEESLGFHNSNCSVQLRFLDAEGNAFASPISKIAVDDILDDGVIQ